MFIFLLVQFFSCQLFIFYVTIFKFLSIFHVFLFFYFFNFHMFYVCFVFLSFLIISLPIFHVPWHQRDQKMNALKLSVPSKRVALTRCAAVFLFSRTLLTPPPSPLTPSNPPPPPMSGKTAPEHCSTRTTPISSPSSVTRPATCPSTGES